MMRLRVIICVLALTGLLGSCQGTESNNSSRTAAADANPVQVFALNVGNAIASDQAAAPMTMFAPSDKIIASIQTRGIAPNAELAAKLISYQDGQVYGQQAQSIHPSGPATTNFAFPRDTPWPVGHYVVEVALNGKLAVRQEIDVSDDLPSRPLEAASHAN